MTNERQYWECGGSTPLFAPRLDAAGLRVVRCFSTQDWVLLDRRENTFHTPALKGRATAERLDVVRCFSTHRSTQHLCSMSISLQKVALKGRPTCRPCSVLALAGRRAGPSKAASSRRTP